jgi:hypothetical protein
MKGDGSSFPWDHAPIKLSLALSASGTLDVAITYGIANGQGHEPDAG